MRSTCVTCTLRDTDGRCHFDPPQLVPEMISQPGSPLVFQLSAYWPWVPEDGWCSHYSWRSSAARDFGSMVASILVAAVVSLSFWVFLAHTVIR